jgi:hypothetical protein
MLELSKKKWPRRVEVLLSNAPASGSRAGGQFISEDKIPWAFSRNPEGMRGSVSQTLDFQSVIGRCRASLRDCG